MSIFPGNGSQKVLKMDKADKSGGRSCGIYGIAVEFMWYSCGIHVVFNHLYADWLPKGRLVC